MNHASSLKSRIIAVVEVIIVVFLVVPFVTLSVYRLFPRFETWQTDVGFDFPVFVYVVMVTASLIAILLRRKHLADYGLHFRNLKFQLGIATAGFFPVVASSIPMASGVDYKSWGGSFIMALVQIALLFFLGWSMRKKNIVSAASAAAASTAVFFFPWASGNAQVARAIPLFLTYALFVGFGEEIIYRGYMHTRLTEVFGKPYTFFGVRYGWGMIITALLFGLTHVGIITMILGSTTQLTPAWGLWTAFGGLVFGFIREKSGGILAGSLLHGLPQAIAMVAFLFI